MPHKLVVCQNAATTKVRMVFDASAKSNASSDSILHIQVREEDRDSFRFLYNVNDIKNDLRFTRVPFRAKASFFVLGATLQHHLENQPSESSKENTYVDNLLNGGEDVASLANFKGESSDMLQSGKFSV